MTTPTSFNEQKNQAQGASIKFLSEPSEISMADEWFELIDADHFWMKWRFEAMNNMIPKDFDWGSVLDIGCGNGIVGEQIRQSYGCDISGCDLSLKALQLIPKGRQKLYFYNIFDQNKEFEEAFSTLLMMDVLEHIEKPIAFLEAANFHLKPGGHLIINVPANCALYSKYDKVAGHQKRYNVPAISEELYCSGFEIVSARYWGMGMIPFFWIRKLVLHFYDEEKIIETSLQKNARIIPAIMNAFRIFECGVLRRVPVGTSLLVLARKRS